ncbi:MFS transporter [Goodfellowiella coeruleoviolacea]|uniref:Major Facilitator Superfamily protein n=1 Tax=Goodfellowiella coeruleoviolacea TaxID=334858 RepID=A0AAE3GB27_9PSEU|nr:MFS transporter [Goodfellowiella coeruleoviolacea]MCP2164971.1 Major Facilitator Superfamily protein [Goodfellowiella coeruleoviolacea]
MAVPTSTDKDSDSRDDRRAGLPARLVLPVAVGILLQPINSSMIAVALVQIRDEFDAGASASWLISGLYLATAVAAPTMGRLADLLGARRVFLAGLVLVGVAATAGAFAPSIGWLVATRVVLGIGTAAPFPAGLALVRAEADRRGLPSSGSGLSVLAAASQIAVALGPALGGVLVQVAGWRAIFLVNLPIAAAAGLLGLRFLPADPAPPWAGAPRGGGGRRPSVLSWLDLLGMGVFTSTTATLMLWLLSLSGQPDWGLLGVLGVLVAVLVWWELRVRRPFVDVRLLAANHALTATYLRTGLTFVAFYSIFYGLPAWMQQARGLDPAGAGLVLLPVAGLGVLTVALATRLERRTGPRLLLVIGSAVLLTGSALLFGVDRATPVLLLVGVAAVLGVPNGFNNLGNQTALYRAAPADQIGGASGLYRTSQYVGANLAACLIELCFAGPASDAGLHRLAVAVAVISAALLVTALVSRGLRTG